MTSITNNEKHLAIRIVIWVWIIPSNKKRRDAIKKVQKFCRRMSGVPADPLQRCISPRNFGPPPAVWRQTCSCSIGDCPYMPHRWRKKRLLGNEYLSHGLNAVGYSLSVPLPAETADCLAAAMDGCACNWKPFKVYDRWWTQGNLRPDMRGEFHAAVFRAMADDKMLPHCRIRISNLIHRTIFPNNGLTDSVKTQ